MNKVFIFKDFEVILQETGAHVVVLYAPTAKPAIVAGLWRVGWPALRPGSMAVAEPVHGTARLRANKKGTSCHIGVSP